MTGPGKAGTRFPSRATETLICHLKAALATTHYQEFRAPRYVDGVTYQRAAEL